MAACLKRQKTSDWSELPTKLLGLILNNLTVDDHVRFNCVCKSWNIAVKEKAWCLKPDCSPWLLQSYEGNRVAKFLSLSENRTYHIPLPMSNPHIREREFIGSSYGWLVSVDKVLWETHLLNPVTGVLIKLPPITTLPYLIADERERDDLFYKAVLSAPPSADGSGDFQVILIHYPFTAPEKLCTMAITRVGDDSWSIVKGFHNNIVDILSHRGKIYGVDVGGVLYVWDQHHISSRPEPAMETRNNRSELKMLVGHATGNHIFMLDFLLHKRGKLKVVKIDMDKPEKKFVVVNDMDDNIIFASLKTTFSVCATRFPKLRKNCIYYTDGKNLNFDGDDFDVGVFDMKDQSVEHLPNHRLLLASPLFGFFLHCSENI